MAKNRNLQEVRKYTKDKIIMTVKDLERKGIDLSDINLRREGFEGMINAARREFKDAFWYRILKKIGIAKDYRRHVRKDIKSVLKEIKRLYKKGEDLRPVAMIKSHSALYSWVERNCKYWELLDKCGIDPNKIYCLKKPQRFWSKEKILEALENIPEDYLPQTVMRKKYPCLYYAICGKRIFKRGYGEAINELGRRKGIKNYYNRIRMDRDMASKYGMAFQNLVEKVFDVLHKKYESQVIIRYTNTTIIPDFVDTKSGSWIDAKVNPYSPEVEKIIQRALKYGKKLLIVYLKRERKTNNNQIKFRKIDYYYPSLLKIMEDDLVNRIEKLKGEKIPAKTLDEWAVVWPKGKIEGAFRNLINQGEKINSKYLQDNYPRLFAAIIHKYRTYGNFINKIGLDYNYIKEEAKARQSKGMMKYSKEFFLKKGMDYYRKGIKLNPINILNIDPKFYWSATDKNHFGSWKNYIFMLKDYLQRIGYNNFELLKNRNLWSSQI